MYGEHESSFTNPKVFNGNEMYELLIKDGTKYTQINHNNDCNLSSKIKSN